MNSMSFVGKLGHIWILPVNYAHTGINVAAQIMMTMMMMESEGVCMTKNVDEMDRALYECMNTIWKSYRAGAQTFNSCFAGLYKKYGDDPAVVSLIADMGLGLAPAIARKTANENNNQQ